jgi:hypothetical protein
MHGADGKFAALPGTLALPLLILGFCFRAIWLMNGWLPGWDSDLIF